MGMFDHLDIEEEFSYSNGLKKQEKVVLQGGYIILPQ